jgi:hypothetical protein
LVVVGALVVVTFSVVVGFGVVVVVEVVVVPLEVQSLSLTHFPVFKSLT